MAAMITGSDGADTLVGTAGADLVQGFDPQGQAAQPVAIDATLVASGLSQPVFVTAPAEDFSHLFVVERMGRIQVMDLASDSFAPAPFLDLAGQVPTDG